MHNPEPARIREQLERILGSQAFAGAGRHSRVLRYLVERTLAGEADQLKEYVLGLEVFDRDAAYDPRLDSIVRVEVRRLRSRLEDYYRGPGAHDPVVITIPRGAYVPVFTERNAAGATDPPVMGDQAVPRHGSAATRFAAIAAAVAVSTLLIVGTLALNSGRAAPAEASSGPAVAVLPFEHYSSDQEDARMAARLTDAVTSELARLNTVAVASRTSSVQYSGGNRSLPEIARALNVQLVLEATAIPEDRRWRVVVRLVDAALDRKVWVAEYELDPRSLSETVRQIAADTSAAAVQHASR